ncbi:hypothetical protein [Streptomyces sp. NPDC040750]|uniref:hypothetical protein n=1 Tax=Streptomyces sp. NPDC040750 TaxID=3154491 RepID=UPI0033D41414
MPGLVNGKVSLGPYESTDDRRLTSTKLAAAADTEDGCARVARCPHSQYRTAGCAA